MKFRSTLLLFAIFAALCAGYWGMQQYGEHKHRAIQEAKRVFHFDGKAVRGLEIQRINEASTAATRDDKDVWTMTKPGTDIRPLQLMWTRVADKLSELTNERTLVEHPDDLAGFGLKEPALIVTATLEKGPVKAAFGNFEPTESFRYARVDEGPVFLVSKDMFLELNRGLPDLRHRFLVNDRDAALLRIEFVRIWTGRAEDKMDNPPPVGTESVAVVLTRDTKDAPWRMRSPIDAAADQEAVNKLAQEIQFGMTDDFIDNPRQLIEYGLDPPLVRLTVMDEKDRTPQTLLLGNADTGSKKNLLFAKRTDAKAVFRLGGQISVLLPATPDGLRDRRVLTHAAKDIKQFDYKAGDVHFRLEHDAEKGWQMTDPKTERIDQSAVSQYLSLLKTIQGDRFPDGSAADLGLDTPEVSITIQYLDEAAPSKILLKRDPKLDGQYNVTQDTGNIMTMDQLVASSMMSDSGRFLPRELMRFNKRDVTRIDFRFEGQGYAFEKAHDQWVVLTPERKALGSPSDLDHIFDMLSAFYAVSQEPDSKDLAVFGLDQPLFACYVTTKNQDDPNAKEERSGPLDIGKVSSDNSQQRYASSDAQKGVYRVKQDLIDAVREMLRGLRDL
jgi:hypothetical protein